MACGFPEIAFEVKALRWRSDKQCFCRLSMGFLAENHRFFGRMALTNRFSTVRQRMEFALPGGVCLCRTLCNTHNCRTRLNSPVRPLRHAMKITTLIHSRLFVLLFLVIPALTKKSYGTTDDLTAARTVSIERMQQVYDEVKTPFKHGVVIRGETNQVVDCASSVCPQSVGELRFKRTDG